MVGKKRGNSGSLGPSGGRACPGVSGPACAYGRLRVCAGFAPAGRISCALGARPGPPGLCLCNPAGCAPACRAGFASLCGFICLEPRLAVTWADMRTAPRAGLRCCDYDPG